ncbi:MAG TPA: hypothetical protein DIW31_11515 [Bacteroidales bacterium]|nr:hypothetical protein [Bacteroidales bacterium]
MKNELKEKFIELWNKYFGTAELPIAFYFSESLNNLALVEPPKNWNCLICELAKVRKGESLVFNSESIGCNGAKRYIGYNVEMNPTFRYFLSYGIEGKVRGERYKISPEVVDETQKHLINIPSIGENIIFKRWDKLTESDNPEAVIFFAKPEILSGLFTLANFDQVDPQGVISPFGPGCGSIIHYPYLENSKDNPKCVLGMFDPSARTCVPENTLSFAIPMKKFEKIISYMEESFLITPTWAKARKRFEN